ncbi:hypothetical protein C8R47DRAFT_1075638 [Mycena vitilis]|nr:hypothetical protein C8R47DRAFT_1075638 [Mycena vitilis]
MVNNRSFIPVAAPQADVFLRARLYSTTTASPPFASVLTRTSANPYLPRFPCVEGVMDPSGVQPHVHDVTVRLRHGRAVSRFRIFFKRHRKLPFNATLDLQGDVVVMRVAVANAQSVVNLRAADRALVDFVLARVSARIRDFQGSARTRLPRDLELVRARR